MGRRCPRGPLSPSQPRRAQVRCRRQSVRPRALVSRATIVSTQPASTSASATIGQYSPGPSRPGAGRRREIGMDCPEKEIAEDQ